MKGSLINLAIAKVLYIVSGSDKLFDFNKSEGQFEKVLDSLKPKK